MPEVNEGTPAAEPAVVSTPEDSMAAVFDKFHPDERVTRGDSGKFESKTPVEAKETPAEAAEAPAEPESTSEPVAETTEPAKPAIGRPQSWSADLDEWWKTLPPDRQEFLAKRESEAHSKISQLGETAKNAERFQSVIDRYKHVIRDAPDREIESLLATKDALLRSPEQSIQWLAQQLGVNLSKLVQPQNPSDPADPTGPLLEKIAMLERRLNDTTNHLTARERSEQQTREQALAKQVEDFAKDKDYWPEIENEVLAQVQALRFQHPEKSPNEILKEAHDRAVKLNDAVNERLTKAQREAEAKKKAEEDKRKAEAAKKIAQLNVKSSASSPKPSTRSVTDQMNEVYDRLAG